MIRLLCIYKHWHSLPVIPPISSHIFLRTQGSHLLILLILLLLEGILLGCPICTTKAIPERNVLPIVIIEMQMVHSMTRSTINNPRSGKILRIICKTPLANHIHN